MYSCKLLHLKTLSQFSSWLQVLKVNKISICLSVCLSIYLKRSSFEYSPCTREPGFPLSLVLTHRRPFAYRYWRPGVKGEKIQYQSFRKRDVTLLSDLFSACIASQSLSKIPKLRINPMCLSINARKNSS